MPVDVSNKVNSRGAFHKIAEDGEAERFKRNRGEISCKECRRLKLKCSKDVPCKSCIRRGCSSICPNGSLSSAKGNRFILADTEHLHLKIGEMSSRIGQLEDALSIVYATVSSDQHPLLEEDLLKVKFAPESHNLPCQIPKRPGASETIDTSGTITLEDNGEMKYYGRSAGSEILLLTGEDSPSPYDSGDETAYSDIVYPSLGDQFPFTRKNNAVSETSKMLLSSLPSRQRAISLSDNYMENAAPLFRPIDKDDLNETLHIIYNMRIPPDPQIKGLKIDICSHKVAIVFFILAIGALFDISLPQYNKESERYYDLGCAALSLRSVFDSPQVHTVQAVASMAAYQYLGGKEFSRDRVWAVVSLTSKLAQSIGLHRDCARWNLDSRTVQRRRTLFWDIVVADTLHSLGVGRPPTINLAYADCEFPIDEEESMNEKGEIAPGYYRRKHIYTRDLLYSVVENTLSARVPNYDTILDIDRKIREVSFPTAFQPYPKPEDIDYHSSAAGIRSFCHSQTRVITLLYLHRSFFAQAFLDHPKNPFRSQYAPSCLSAYRCSTVVIKAFASHFQRYPEIAMRVWPHLTHVFSAAVIVGSVVARSSGGTMAASGLFNLNLAVSIFERTAVESVRARAALRVLYKLRDKASRTYAYSCHSPAIINAPYAPEDDVEEELALFGGQIRVLDRKSSSPPGSEPSSSSAGNSPGASATSSNSDIHPSLLNYLDTLPSPSSRPASGEISPFTWLGESDIPSQTTKPELSSPTGGSSDGGSSPDAMFGLDFSSDSSTETQWMAFMQRSGILDESP